MPKSEIFTNPRYHQHYAFNIKPDIVIIDAKTKSRYIVKVAVPSADLISQRVKETYGKNSSQIWNISLLYPGFRTEIISVVG